MSKKKNRRFSLILGIINIVLAVGSATLIFLQKKLPVSKFFSWATPIALTQGPYALLSVAALLLVLGILFLVCRKQTFLSYIFIPYTVAFYLTMMMASHKLLAITKPVFIMSKLANTKLSLLFVLILLELILALLLLLLVQSVNAHYKKKLKLKAEIEKRREAENPVVEPPLPKKTEEKVKVKPKKSVKKEPLVVPTREKEKEIEKEEETEVIVAKKVDPNKKIEFPSFTSMPSLDSLEKDKAKLKKKEKLPPDSLVGLNTFSTIKNEVTEQESEKIDLSKPQTFKKGGLLEATLESVTKENKTKPEVVKPVNQKPIIGFDTKTEEVKPVTTDSIAPSTLPKSHPRYKLFEALKREPKKTEETTQVSYFPSKPFEAKQESPREPDVASSLEEATRLAQKEEVKTKPISTPSFKEVKPELVITPPPYKEPVQAIKAPEPESVEKAEIGDLAQVNNMSGVGGLKSNNEGLVALARRAKFHYEPPSTSFLKEYPSASEVVDEKTIALRDIILQTMKDFHIEADADQITIGPTVTMFEYRLAPGILVTKLNNIQKNLSINLRGRSIRILTQIPGKQTVGVEVANEVRQVVGFKELLYSIENQKFRVPMILGKTITGEPICLDVAKTPHLLIAGTTGSGKSVCVNSLICSILYTKSPKEVRLIMVDPKIVELSIYNGIGHLLTPVITEQKKVIKALDWLVDEMQRRYTVMRPYGVRNIDAYNEKIQSGEFAAEKFPFIVLIMDEFADLMATAGKEIEDKVARLCAMSRAVGIHVVMATQRPSTDVITGTIKSNIPTRIAFAVSSGVNSRIILDEQGAEDLLGKGDMLYLNPSQLGVSRIQGAFLSDNEVEQIVKHVRTQGEPDYLDPDLFEDIEPDEDNMITEEGLFNDEADLYEKAKQICYERKCASASYLQRRMKIGYNKAARYIEQMEDEGIVGPAQGSKPREILDYTK